MVYTGKLFGSVEFFEIFQEYSRNMQIFNVHPGTYSTFQEYPWYILCCTGQNCTNEDIHVTSYNSPKLLENSKRRTTPAIFRLISSNKDGL